MEVHIRFAPGHGLEQHTAEIDMIAREYIGNGCAGVSVNDDSVRIVFTDDYSEPIPVYANDQLDHFTIAINEYVQAAIDAINQFVQQLEG